MRSEGLKIKLVTGFSVVLCAFFYSVYTSYEPEQFSRDSHEISPCNYLLGML